MSTTGTAAVISAYVMYLIVSVGLFIGFWFMVFHFASKYW